MDIKKGGGGRRGMGEEGRRGEGMVGEGDLKGAVIARVQGAPI
jgi:hypothetical protein